MFKNKQPGHHKPCIKLMTSLKPALYRKIKAAAAAAASMHDLRQAVLRF
jgi:hypothetical protein